MTTELISKLSNDKDFDEIILNRSNFLAYVIFTNSSSINSKNAAREIGLQ